MWRTGKDVLVMILRKRQRKSKIKNLCVQACYADCACHRMRRKSWFLELVLLVVFSALLSTADGSLSTGKFQVKGLFKIFVSLCLIDSGVFVSEYPSLPWERKLIYISLTKERMSLPDSAYCRARICCVQVLIECCGTEFTFFVFVC